MRTSIMLVRASYATLAVAGLASSTLAQQTQITFEGSTDAGQTWAGGTIAVSPGSSLLVRTRISLIDAGTNTVLGLSGLIFQPTLSGWATTDTRNPFTTMDGSGVEELPQNTTGRILPFASSGMGSLSACGLLTSLLDPGGVLRFAGANAVTSTTNLRWGVSCGQTPWTIGAPFRTGTDAVVFRYSVMFSSVIASPRELTASLDLATLFNPSVRWYQNNAGTVLLSAPVLENTIVPLHIVIPAPGVLAVACAIPILTRRHRHTSVSHCAR